MPLQQEQGLFLTLAVTASYATSKKQPIFSGCFFEVALAR
jgi:Gpi18-like mannosyltransferase